MNLIPNEQPDKRHRPKPEKPSPDFPLYANSNGQWAKKIKGKKKYFGPWADPEAALKRYLAFLEVGPHETDPSGTRRKARAKPEKPYPDYPLYAHTSGQWAKRIRGKVHYFGRWEDWKEALAKFRRESADLYAGRRPRVSTSELTVKDLIDGFLTSKKRLLDAGEIVQRTFDDYCSVCNRIGKSIDLNRVGTDLRADDFEQLRADLSRTRGPVSLGNDITRIKMVFKYAHDAGLVETPIRFGQSLRKPHRRLLREQRNKTGPRMFSANELRRLVDAAGIQLRAMILLGVNCGFGNGDCGGIVLSTLDLDRGWHTFWRPKTHNPRRCPLWPETIAAIREVVANRPRPAKEGDGDYVFLTVKGNRWARDHDRPISKEFRKLLNGLGIYRKNATSFYSLRRTFETVGGEALDQIAVDFIMGHIAPSDDMAAVYRQEISDSRLKAVTDHVRHWLFFAGQYLTLDASSPETIPVERANPRRLPGPD